ncbi:TlpA family protein disulfide reductase [Xanthobacter aminoxidans]|uniref:TlpA disulfide reductase family protein n=1 Tax=Xanthobacter aminoxidans TaxID=186280 RepID=A0ABW6ZJN7_9HYPH
MRDVPGAVALALLLAAGPVLAAPVLAEAERAAPGLLATVEGHPLAPALSLGALDGAPVTLAAGDPPTIVHFFATWCAPCRTELPALADFVRLSGVRVLLVDVAEPADRIRRFFAEGTAGATPGPVLLDQNRAAARGWGVSLLPASFVVISGRLVLAREGEVDWADPETRAAIRVAAPPPQKNQPKEAQGEQTR